MDKEKIIAEAMGKAWEIIGHHRYKTDLVAREIAEALLPIIERAVREDERNEILDRILAYLEDRRDRTFVPSMILWIQALRSSGKEGEG